MAAPVKVGRTGDEEDRVRKGKASPRGALQDLEALAWVLDNSIEIPGLRFRIGVESLLGLVPVLGDLVGALISSYILFLSARLGASRVTLIRMALNVGLEAAVGVVPLAGDIFDFAWKANSRNVELLRAHLRDPLKARRSDWVFSILLVLALLGVLVLFGWAAYSLGRAVSGLFQG